MLEYIKARLRVWFNKETQEMKDNKRRADCIYQIANAVVTDQHDPWAHLTKVTNAMIQLSDGERITFDLVNDTKVTITLTGQHVDVLMDEMDAHVPMLIPVMLEWISYYRKYDCKK